MKKVKLSLGLTILLISSGLTIMAQQGNAYGRGGAEQRKQIETHKIAYLTDKLDLTTSEAQLFWPVYNAHRDKMEAERADFRKKLSEYQDDDAPLSDENANKIIEEVVAHEQRMLDMRRSYLKELNTALSPQKIVKLIEAEKGFREELVRRVSRGHGSGNGRK